MKILIVEDEALLALELESELQSAGHEVVGHAMASDEARHLAERCRPDFAFVDIHLVDGPTGIDVGRHLRDQGIPYVFVTGNLKRIPEDFAGAIGAIEKPYTMNGLKNAVTFLEALVTHDGAIANAPPSLVVAPAFAC
ncbi:response regulator [Rhizobium rhizosphaerae]|uniref:Response regulator n=1 Tax=Xaviernesmea rhizosphaerae TaxID=1672749 RepID=A0A1Q9AQJ6_9HYPH|nr:response regulator [Xaviernesmea rhizosphaerae]OLP57692.1 response regulator [Xaviernesmea rhizosphaerae]OQP84187.1 response regulator [Xaviernesmea rhizosphaerae]